MEKPGHFSVEINTRKFYSRAPLKRGGLPKAFTERLFGLRKRSPTGQHEFDLLCAELGIEHRLTPPMRPQSEPLSAIGPRTMASGMVERFNGRIEDVMQCQLFHSGEDLKQTILR